jgi:predicted DNA-binding protein with PD1-like motif
MMFKKVHVFRIKPGGELLSGVESYCREHKITSGIVIGIIGSAQKARLHFLKELPGKYEAVDYTGPLEIVGAQGSIALRDDELIIHIHILISGKDICRGGHLAEAVIFTTAEVTIGELDYQLQRYFDEYTGLNELTL